MDAFYLPQEIHAYIEGRGLAYDSWRRNKDQEEIRLPPEVSHVNPHFAAEGTSNRTNRGPEVKRCRSF